jgi:hypothetical protein
VTAPGDARIAAAATRLVQATREPAGAAALVVALVHPDATHSPRWDEGWACAASRHGALRAAIAELPRDAMRSLRWPLMEIAVARLRPLSPPAREALLAIVRDRVEADGRTTLTEWIYHGLLRLRLGAGRPGPRMAVLGHPIDARSIRVLFALVGQCAHVTEARAERAANAAIRALDLVPIGGSTGPLTLDALDAAVRRVAQLPPLDRPILVKQLVALLPHDAGPEVRDFLRLLCVAIDCPPPVLPSRGRPSRADADDALADADA